MAIDYLAYCSFLTIYKTKSLKDTIKFIATAIYLAEVIT